MSDPYASRPQRPEEPGLTGVRVAVCARAGSGALRGLLLTAVEPDAAAAQMRMIRPAVATKG